MRAGQEEGRNDEDRGRERRLGRPLPLAARSLARLKFIQAFSRDARLPSSPFCVPPSFACSRPDPFSAFLSIIQAQASSAKQLPGHQLPFIQQAEPPIFFDHSDRPHVRSLIPHDLTSDRIRPLRSSRICPRQAVSCPRAQVDARNHARSRAVVSDDRAKTARRAIAVHSWCVPSCY